MKQQNDKFYIKHQKIGDEYIIDHYSFLNGELKTFKTLFFSEFKAKLK